jgi:hypothetical protein
LTLSAEGKPTILFGLSVSSLLGANNALSEQLQDVHEALTRVRSLGADQLPLTRFADAPRRDQQVIGRSAAAGLYGDQC